MQTVVIGRNGTCKTTLLRAIALAFADEQDAAALLSAPNGRWVTEGAKEGAIRLYLEPIPGGEPVVRIVKLTANTRQFDTAMAPRRNSSAMCGV